MRLFSLLILLFVFYFSIQGQDQSAFNKRDIIYTSSQDIYAQERCRLDMYIPSDSKDFTTLIWFHGGGLTSGDKDIPEAFKGHNFAVVSASYRFSPIVSVQDIIADAAEAVKWTKDHIEQYGGNRHKVIIGGYSAGAYLALMLGLQKEYLQKHQIDANNLLGILSCSGQTITHFTERNAQNMKDTQPLVDHMAPLYWVRGDAAPILLITGDRELEMLGRYEENAYLRRMLKLSGHPDIQLLELQGYDHGMLYPAIPLLIKEIKKRTQ